MINPSSSLLAKIVAVAAIVAGSSANADDVVIEAPMATRIVRLSLSDLANPDQLKTLHRRLRAAAIDVCSQEYRNPTGMIYYYMRACYSGSFRDALGQLREIQKRQLALHGGVDTQIAILIRSK